MGTPQQYPLEPTAARTEVITVACQKGGVGKTTMTVNLAATFAETLPPREIVKNGLTEYQPQVLAVSTDPQASLLEWLENVEKRMEKTDSGEPMPIDYTQEDENPQVLSRLKKLQQYRKILVDSPGWLEKHDAPILSDEPPKKEENILRATLEATDFVIVPLELESLAFTPTKRTIERILKPMGVPFLVVLNNWETRDGLGNRDDTRRRAEKQGWPVANTVVRRFGLHSKAPDAGLLCTQYPSNRAAVEARVDYLRLGIEIGDLMRGAA